MNDEPSLIAFLDANVLYPARLRDLLMHLALRRLFQPRWSARVHEEWMTAVLSDRSDLTVSQLQRTRGLMEENIKDALVDGYEPIVDQLTLPDADDRHVLAAAIHGRANVIITANLRDFPAEALSPHDVEAVHSRCVCRSISGDRSWRSPRCFV
jgi:predicted nucleic acid-binding protein